MQAKLTSPRRFYFLPVGQNLGLDGLLTFAVYSDAGEPLTDSPFSAHVVVSPAELSSIGIYRTGEVNFPTEGAYYTLWACQVPAIKVSGQVAVLGSPIGDVPTGLPRKYRYTSANFGVINDLVLRVYGPDGKKVGPTHATDVTVINGVYETVDSFLINTEGLYLFVWTSVLGGYAATQIEEVLVLSSTTRTARVFVIDASQDPQVPQAGADVLISKPNGTPLFQAQLNEYGYADFALPDGNYIATAKKSGVTYGKNNLALVVSVPSATNNNTFFLLSAPFSPTFDPAPLFAQDKKSRLLVDLADMHGEPIVGVRILLSNRYVPDKKVGISGGPVGLLGGPIEITTDGNGHAETLLLRGALVTVAFEGTSVRRTITVPSQASFNLLDLVNSEDDPFDVIIPNIVAAERRS